VSRVRVAYRGAEGKVREAPVHFIRVSDDEFGVYLAFLPPSIRYRPQTRSCPERGTFDREAIELIAYDDRGEEITRETVWNIISMDSPSCP
jgi:hypothetical protein